jgi:4'-phosphopantetheinyl transferase
MTTNPPQPLPLAPGQADIWLTKVAPLDEELAAAYQALLSEAELARWRKFAVPGPKLHYLVAKALLRTSLSRYASVAPEEWRFETNAYGWPYIVHPEPFRPLRFNLSHTEGLAACVVTWDCDIGIDVENIRRDVDFMQLAEWTFAPQEAAAMAMAAPSNRRNLFYSCWTLKEAYVKARRMGLSLPLTSFWFDLNHNIARANFTEQCPDNPDRWTFQQALPTSDHCLALALSTPAPNASIGIRWTVPLVSD